MAFFRKDGSFQRVRPLGKIFLYTFSVLLCGALAAPWAWSLIQDLPSDLMHGLIGEVQRMPFHRYVSRSIQVTAILLLWPLLRSLHVRSLQELGLFPCTLWRRDFLIGLGSGVPSVLLLALVAWGSGAFEFQFFWSLKVASRILLTAVVVAILVEFLFRGVILGFLRQFLARWIAIVLSAVLFAALHFLNFPTSGTETMPPHWQSGLSLLMTFVGNLPSWPIVGWAFATLLCAGVLLGWLTTRTGSLWASIALHGSWIIAQQFFNSVARYKNVPSEAFLPLVGPAQCHGAVPIGLAAIFCLVLAGMLSWMLLRNRPWPRIYTRVSR